MSTLSAMISDMLKERGKVQMDRHEILDPKVEHTGDMAVVSYNWACYVGTDVSRWRATDVYRRGQSGWRIVHLHWSLVQPPAPPR